MVNREILRQEAIAQGMDAEIEQEVIRYRNSRLIDGLRSKIILEDRKNNRPDVEELNKRMEEKIKLTTKVKSLEIKTNNKEKAEEILNKIINSEDKSAVIDSLSKDESVSVKEKPTTTANNNKFQVLEVGEVSEISEDNGNYIILFITEATRLPDDSYMGILVATEYNRERGIKSVEEFVEKVKSEKNYDIEVLQ